MALIISQPRGIVNAGQTPKSNPEIPRKFQVRNAKFQDRGDRRLEIDSCSFEISLEFSFWILESPWSLP
jgi:hypothetical protein